IDRVAHGEKRNDIDSDSADGTHVRSGARSRGGAYQLSVDGGRNQRQKGIAERDGDGWRGQFHNAQTPKGALRVKDTKGTVKDAVLVVQDNPAIPSNEREASAPSVCSFGGVDQIDDKN
ncbi:MAG: hypothetical protein DWI10_07055, partial [Planctomycetota bacterium]